LGSPLYQQGRDLEVFSSLIYLRALFETDLNLNQQSGLQAVAHVTREAQTLDTIIALQESAYLRSRFNYLLAAIAAVRPFPDPTEVLKTAGVNALLEFITNQDQALGSRLRRSIDGPQSRGEAAISSARLGGDV
jgi:hypothetical protein